MTYAIICFVAALASVLTFFSGFGLGTLLLPAFALFFPVQVAVTLTAIVHFLNGIFKLALVGRSANRAVVLRFGLPAIFAAYGGARLLYWLTDQGALYSYTLAGRQFIVTPIKLVIAVLMILFSGLELWPRFKKAAVPPKYLPLGGVLTGFFGGLSGHQGAFRTIFLLRTGLEKEILIATGVAIAALVDLSRIPVYLASFTIAQIQKHGLLLAAATGSAFLGAYLGNRLLKKVTLRVVELAVALMLAGIAVAMGAGWI